MKKEHVNLPNTREWVKCNEDSKAHLWREKFVNIHGGEFKRNERSWQWFNQIYVNQKIFEQTEKPKKVVVANQKQLYIFTDPDGREIITDNLSKFCRENKLNKSTIYLVMNGKRNHHKHFKCRKVED